MYTRHRRVLRIALSILIGGAAGSWGFGAVPPELPSAVEHGETALIAKLLGSGVDVNGRDAAGNTALHFAALNNDERTVRALLERHATVDILNGAGATPLIFGAGHPGIVKLLLEHGANPNVAAKSEITPLVAAVQQGESLPSAKLLLAHGANVRAQVHGGDAPLRTAIFGGDLRTVRLLLEHGAAVNQTKGMSPLLAAAFVGDAPILEFLLNRGAELNYPDEFAGHALNTALYTGHTASAALLIAKGSSISQRSPIGYATPPMVWSAYNETGDATIARLLIARGADVNAANEAGETALSYALRTGPHTPLVEFLRASGAKESALPPARPAALYESGEGAAARTRDLPARLQLAVNALQHSSDAFLNNGFVQAEGKCVSCHQQTLPAMAYSRLRGRGVNIDEVSLGKQLAAELKELAELPENAREMNEPLPDAPINISYGLAALQAWNFPVTDDLRALSGYLVSAQRPGGWWVSFDLRPPIEEGPILGAAWALRTIYSFPPAGRDRETASCLARGREYLRNARPENLNQQVFQVLGLAWSGVSVKQLQSYITPLLAAQRADGGWASLPGLESDAYATGEVLAALREATGQGASAPAYRRGVDFLLHTQLADGTWHVRSRAWPFQPHFDGQFPHGKDQWVSAGATSWAVLALAELLPGAPTSPSSDSVARFTALYEKSVALAKPTAVAAAPSMANASMVTVDFARDVHPLLERSCLNCHGGEKPKGGLSLTTREALLKGGQSGQPAIVPGASAQSQLLEFIADHVEDLEMPPLSRREKYPPLAENEIARLRTWIDEGALWSK